MADVKISALPATAGVTDTSLFPISNVATEKATGVQVATYVQAEIQAAGIFATDTLVVHLAGVETVTGAKAFSADPTVPDSVYGAGWNGLFTVPTKNAVYDQIEILIASIALKAVDTAVVHNTGAENVGGVKTFTSIPLVPDDIYAVGWDASTGVPTKNAIYDKIEAVIASIALKANDSAVVHNTGNETIAGAKTFSTVPLVPDEAYGVTWNGALAVPTKNAVYDQMVIMITDTGTRALDSTVVHNTGNETIGGIKTFSSDPLIPDEIYGVGWNASLEPPTKNAVYDQMELRAIDTTVVHNTGAENVGGVKTFTSDPLIPDEIYGVGWNGSLEPPTKNAVYDKIETISGGSGLTQAQVLVLQSMKGF